MENSGKRSSEDGAFYTNDKRLNTHRGDNEKNSISRIVWKFNGQVTGISVDIPGPAKAPAVENKEAKRSIKGTTSKPWIGCSCGYGVDASAQCHQPLSTPRCRGLRSKLLHMGVRNPVCCLRKTIAFSDIDRGQNRLLLPNDLLNKSSLKGMLTADEERKTVELSGLAVRTLDKAGREYQLTLRFVESIGAYRIIGRGYTRLVVDNGFRPGQLVDLLVFRVPPRNEFAMGVIEYDKAAEEVSAAVAAATDIVSLCGHGEMVSAANSVLSLRMALERLLEARQRHLNENNNVSGPFTK